ncbi:sigma-54-dependent transcriptional regulator [Singulisphaera rosea]
MSKPRLLIVHPEPSALALLTSMLTSMGHDIEEAPNDRAAVRAMERGGVDLMVLGADPTDFEGLEVLAYMRRKHRSVPVILLFPGSFPERTKEALRMGAMIVLKYPVPATELRAAVIQALAPTFGPLDNAILTAITPSTNGITPTTAVSRTAMPQSRPEQPTRDRGFVGNDPSLRQVIELATSIAPLRLPILIMGESGTGKSLLAKLLHSVAARGTPPFILLDCRPRGDDPSGDDDRNHLNSLPAIDWPRKFAEAEGGTLLLDEVSNLSDELEQGLYRFLQDRGVGAQVPGRAPSPDVRLVMTTSENLMALVEQGAFRQDLYHRIGAISLVLPPLRHRVGDIDLLAESFRVKFSLEQNKNVVGFTRDALEALNKHDWPGNVRELEELIQAAVGLCQGSRITSGHISTSMSQPAAPRIAKARPATSIRPLKESLEEPEKKYIIQALQSLNWNRQETARVLDINRTTLYKKMKKYGLLVDGPIWIN